MIYPSVKLHNSISKDLVKVKYSHMETHSCSRHMSQYGIPDEFHNPIPYGSGTMARTDILAKDR